MRGRLYLRGHPLLLQYRTGRESVSVAGVQVYAMAAINITIRLFTVLQQYLTEGTRGRATLSLSEGTSVGQVLDRLGIPQDIPTIILVNGAQKNRDHVLCNGDELTVFPPIAGG